MSRVSILVDAAGQSKFIHRAGYAVVVFMHAGDGPSEQFSAKCAEYSRMFPFVRFASMDMDHAQGVLVGGSPMTHIPTTAFFRNGVACGQLTGTDYAMMEKILASMRRDGPQLVSVPQQGSRIFISKGSMAPIFNRRK